MYKLQLGFHGTFALKKEDIIKILSAAAEPQGLNDKIENLMGRTSLGNKKVGPIKSWATRAGLLHNNHLSSEGEIVMNNDSQLESITTEWLMHFYLTFGEQGLNSAVDNPADWGGWTYFVYSFLPKHRFFTLAELVDDSVTIFEGERSKLNDNFKFMLRAYTEKNALYSCKFIKEEREGYKSGDIKAPNQYLIGYLLAKIWERDFGKVSSVFVSDLLDHRMGLPKVFGIGIEGTQEMFDKLEVYSIIEQRRTVPPFQVIRRWDDPLDLLRNAYERGD